MGWRDVVWADTGLGNSRPPRFKGPLASHLGKVTIHLPTFPACLGHLPEPQIPGPGHI